MWSDLLNTDPDWAVTVARVTLGVVFFGHGAQKLIGWFGGSGLKNTLQTMSQHLGLPPALALGPIAAEFFGGLGLILGVLSRVDAAAIAVTMVVAIWMVHARHGLFLNWYGNKQGHGYEYHLLAIALALVVVVRGGGALSLDQLFFNAMNA
jgi:putative oxidoreductase